MNFDFGGTVVQAESFDSALEHLSLYHPRINKEFEAGRIEVVSLDPVEQARLDAERVAKKELDDVQKKILHAFFAVINEIRGLKSQPPLTRAQFLEWMRSL